MSKRVLNKVQGAFQDLGIELKKGHSLYEFEYEHVFMFLSMDAKDQSIAFVTYVVDSGDISMDEQILNTALDIVDGFHEDCCGDWNDGVPYFVSPCYADACRTPSPGLPLNIRITPITVRITRPDRKSTRLNSSHTDSSRMPSSA